MLSAICIFGYQCILYIFSKVGKDPVSGWVRELEENSKANDQKQWGHFSCKGTPPVARNVSLRASKEKALEKAEKRTHSE